MTLWAFCDANYAETTRPKIHQWVCVHAGQWIHCMEVQETASVALSTTEAEYYVLGIACQEAIWLKQLCQELLIAFNKPSTCTQTILGSISVRQPVFTTGLSISHKMALHSRARPIQSICTSHIPGIWNGADFLTKALNHSKHECCSNFRME